MIRFKFHGNIKLFKRLRELKPYRKKYKIKWEVHFYRDTFRYYFSFLPTITFLPWIFRHPDSMGVVDIWWLNFHILIGRWLARSDAE